MKNVVKPTCGVYLVNLTGGEENSDADVGKDGGGEEILVVGVEKSTGDVHVVEDDSGQAEVVEVVVL